MVDEFVVRHKECYNILMVDDDDNFRNAHKRLLHLVHFQRLNAVFEVSDVNSADAAMQKLKEASFDCILLDYAMPGRDGLSCMNDINLLYPDMPIILFTGAGNENVAVNALKEGAMDYLIKGSISIEMLEMAIVNAITKATMLKHIEEQKKQILDAERDRVMVQTLASACHHLGQPVSVIRTCLVILKRQADVDSDIYKTILSAYAAIESVCEILWKMNHVYNFTTEPYLKAFSSTDENEMLKLE